MVLPWYRRTLTIVLFLIFLFPVGLVLLWLRSDWSVRRRGLVTALVLVVLIAAIPGAKTPASAPRVPAAAASDAAGVPGASASPDASGTPAVAAAPVTSLVTTQAAPSTTAARAVVVAPPAPARTTHAAPPPAAPPPAAPPAQPSTCGAPSNPYGYNFCGDGSDVYSPPGDICNYFNCIDNFSNGHGYMVECKDGTYSMSGGVRGACSDHGGESRPVDGG